jgi:YHS domain-containing protein
MKNTFLFVVAYLSLTAAAQSISKRTASFNLESNLAIQGYDPVAYFMQKKAIEGKSNLTTTYDGIIYHFSSKDNKDLFLKNPASFEPQYSVWCAYAMGSSGEQVEIDPKTFKLIDNKLYLFYNAFFNNTLKSWNKDEINLKKKADLNWKKFKNEKI